MKIKNQFIRHLFSIFLCIAILLSYVPGFSFMTFAAPTDSSTYTVSFDSNGGSEIDAITVNYGEKYGKLPSTSLTGLSGGDSNWYLVDEEGNVTETKITSSSVVSTERNHTLFVVRKVLAPSVKLALTVPGAISDSYQYYVPDNSIRVLKATISNQNDDILTYVYAWYKDGVLLENENESTLTLDGNVSDTGTYKVVVTATLKDDTNIVVSSDTASAEKEQKVNIMRLANTLAFDANGGEGGSSSSYTNSTTITVRGTTEPTRTGYIFLGWNTAADGSGDSYKVGDTVNFTEDNGNGGCNVTLYAQWIKTYGIYIGGVQVTEANKNDVLGDGKVSYDAETNTLTLNGANIINGYEYKEAQFAGIYADDTLDIVLLDTNKVTSPDSTKISYGIYVQGDLNISGSGNLTANGGAVISQDNDADSVGILVEGQFTISKANVTANGGSAVVNGAGNAYSDGICARNGLNVDFGGGLYAMGGKTQGIEAYSMGIECGMDNEINNVAVYSGYINAESGEAIGTVVAYSNGIFILNGNLYLYEKESEVFIVAGNAKEATSYAYSNGIFVYGGDVGVEAGSLTVSNGSFTGERGDAYAIYIMAREDKDDEGNTYYIGGYFNIDCEEVLAGTYSPNLLGTTITINAPNGNAIYADMGINISNNLIISVPENGEVKGVGGSTDPENWIEPNYFTIIDSAGSEAQNVIIKPLGYYVFIKGFSYGMAITVPVGKSINEIYCEMFKVDDFSEILIPKKDGYIFGGWYTDEACTDGNEYNFNNPVTVEVTIYPKWVLVTDEDGLGDGTNKPGDNVENNDNKPDNSEQTGNNTENEDNKKTDSKKNGNDARKNDSKKTDSKKTGNNAEINNNSVDSISPATGYNSNLLMWLTLLLISGVGIFGTAFYDRKRRMVK